MYIYDGGKWRFEGVGWKLDSDTVAITFEQGEPFDVLLNHGPAESIEKLFLSDSYEKLAHSGCRLCMVVVPPRCCEILNKCLAISASKWCSRLLFEANYQIQN